MSAGVSSTDVESDGGSDTSWFLVGTKGCAVEKGTLATGTDVLPHVGCMMLSEVVQRDTCSLTDIESASLPDDIECVEPTEVECRRFSDSVECIEPGPNSIPLRHDVERIAPNGTESDQLYNDVVCRAPYGTESALLRDDFVCIASVGIESFPMRQDSACISPTVAESVPPRDEMTRKASAAVQSVSPLDGTVFISPTGEDVSRGSDPAYLECPQEGSSPSHTKRTRLASCQSGGDHQSLPGSFVSSSAAIDPAGSSTEVAGFSDYICRTPSEISRATEYVGPGVCGPIGPDPREPREVLEAFCGHWIDSAYNAIFIDERLVCTLRRKRRNIVLRVRFDQYLASWVCGEAKLVGSSANDLSWVMRNGRSNYWQRP